MNSPGDSEFLLEYPAFMGRRKEEREEEGKGKGREGKGRERGGGGKRERGRGAGWRWGWERGERKNKLWEEEYIQYNRDLVTALLKNCGCNSQFTQMVISTIEGDQAMSGGMIKHHLSEQQLATATAGQWLQQERTYL